MSDRAARLAAQLPSAGVDVLLVSALVNVRYLTGYTSSNGVALVGPNLRAFITDFRYVEQAADEVDDSWERITARQEVLDAVPEFLPEGTRRLGFEDSHLPVRVHARLVELLGDSVTLVAAGGLVEELRAVKEPEEIARIAAATELADAAYAELIAGGLIGRTEHEVALSLELKMRERGASGPSFETIVAAGPHGALPHATPRDVPIEPDRLVVIDWGARLHGYCSDCTRTVATGEVSDQAREVYALVLEAQLRGLDAVQPGAISREVDAISRMVIDAGGYGEQFGHNLGHGVGLDIHEQPRLSRRSDAALVVDNVVTVEPGIYLPGEFGVRIEDLVVVTDDGVRVLTGIPKDLTVCS